MAKRSLVNTNIYKYNTSKEGRTDGRMEREKEKVFYVKVTDVNKVFPLDKFKRIKQEQWEISIPRTTDNSAGGRIRVRKEEIEGKTTITQTMYASSFASGLGNAFNNIGLAAAMVQAAYDFSAGKDTELFVNLTKNLSNYAIGRWGSNALQLSFVGVYAIDYSINKFATAAWDGRKEIWYEAYKTYYEKENQRTSKQWYSKFYWMWQDNKDSKDPNVLKNAIDS